MKRWVGLARPLMGDPAHFTTAGKSFKVFKERAALRLFTLTLK
jgi:hypothetical protein